MFDNTNEGGDPIAKQAAILSEFTIPELNRLTLFLASYGVAATFSQYIPELHDEDATSEESHIYHHQVPNSGRAGG